MKVRDVIDIVEKGFFLGKEDTLIISDIHIGKEEELKHQGFLIPKDEFSDIKKKMKRILDATNPDHVIINGDLKHNFGRFTYQEWKKVSEFLGLIRDGRNVSVVKGNHDVILKKAVEKQQLTLEDHKVVDDIYITHGDTIPDDEAFQEANTVIIGHVHPAISIGDGVRSEKYECFLKAEYEDKTLLCTPSFNDLSDGVDLLKDKINTPFLTESTSLDAEVFIHQDNDVYDFGTVDSIRQRAS